MQSADNFGQTEESEDKVCCLNETTRFDVAIIYKDTFPQQIAYGLNYAAYLKCQKKCPKNSFTTSDATSKPPPSGDGEVNIWATWKESDQCERCTPGALREPFKVERCQHKGDDLWGGVQDPPPTGDEIQMILDFNKIMETDPPDEMAIRALMTNWVETYCTKAKCTEELKLLCRTVDK